MLVNRVTARVGAGGKRVELVPTEVHNHGYFPDANKASISPVFAEFAPYPTPTPYAIRVEANLSPRRNTAALFTLLLDRAEPLLGPPRHPL